MKFEKVMKTVLKAFLIVLVTSSAAFAQRRGQEGMVRIHAAKMAYITDRLRLTSDQSANFVPLYNEYEREVRATRQSYLGKYKNNHMQDTNDEASIKFIDDNLDYQQAIIDLKRKYNDRFLKIISPAQLAELYKAEREFRQLLLKRLSGAPGGPRGPGGGFR